MGNSALFPLSRSQAFGFLVLGILATTAWDQGFNPSPADAQVELSVTDARTCAALAAYTTPDDDTGLQAAFVSVALNKARTSTPPDCGPGLIAVMRAGLDEQRWQRALDLVDSVMTGDMPMGLGACARATEVVSPSVLPHAAPARAQCVISGYAFVGGDL